MNLTLHIWRQKDVHSTGKMVTYPIKDISPDISFLEMLDRLNEELTEQCGNPVAFDSDCREGICGMCSLTINGIPHGPERATTVCQLHMRHFRDGQEIFVEHTKTVGQFARTCRISSRGSIQPIANMVTTINQTTRYLLITSLIAPIVWFV